MKRSHVAPVVLVLASAVALVAQEAQKPAAAAKPAAPTAPGASQEAAPPTFPAQVEQVIVDVVVTDKKGNAIRGLKQDDMTVIEDGAPQAVVSFEAVELPDQPSATPPPPPRVSVNTAPDEQRGRTFAIVFDDMHITPWKANQAKAAVASFLEKGTREGDRVTLISTAGGTWWTARMESGRPKLLDMVKRFDGRYIPDTSQERMTDCGGAAHPRLPRPASHRARAAALRDRTASGRPCNRTQDSSGRAGTVDDPYITGRASEVYYQAMTRLRTTLDALERALNGLAARQGPQVRDPRLRGLHPRHQPGRVQARQRGVAPRERRHLLPERARPRGHADRDDGPVRAGAAGPGHRLRLAPRARRGGGVGGRGERQRRLHRAQHERPLRRHPEDRQRDPGLLPPRLHPLEHRPRRQVPQDPGEAGQRQGPAGARAQGLLRPERHRQERAWRPRRASTR